jgi:RNA polymerase sigma-70 factor (ECF subfamily)
MSTYLPLIEIEAGQKVREALAKLPEEQRTVLEMAYFGMLTQSEIAAQLRSPLGTVKTRMRAGLHRLRELLRGLRDDGNGGSSP